MPKHHAFSAEDVGCTLEAIQATLRFVREQRKVPAVIAFGPVGWSLLKDDMAKRGMAVDSLDRLFGIPVLVNLPDHQFIAIETEPYHGTP